ncbi:MAG: MotA/TolQ/ExbB proton channel family protein [Candidatus Omnitrophota bacterium]|nr:MotA/TolQ/ExbB proton channel family protein [Candidatus Omnitrophota bacterium]
MLEWIIRGGPMMIPILLCSVAALAIILERFMYLQKIKLDTKKFMSEVSDSLNRNRAMDAINICEQMPGPLPNVLKAGILKYDRTRQEIKEAVEDAALHEIPRMERNISILATIAHISTLMGLLGTVIGMIEVFQKIQEKSAALSPVTPADLSAGIWQALIATAAGLIVAIPTITAYNYFVSRVNNFILQMEISATDLVNILSEKKVE